MARNIQSHKKQGPTSKIPLPSKDITELKGRYSASGTRKKLKEFSITKPLLYKVLKGLIFKEKKIKTKNDKIPTNTYQRLNLKNKLSKQEEQRQNHGYRERFDGSQMGGAYGGLGEEVRGLRSTNR